MFMKKTRVIFVCMGNICRSPTAEGVFRKLALESSLAGGLEVDSAGSHGFHVGEPPDPRSIKHAAMRGVELGCLRARKVTARDFEHFDYVIAMDENNVHQMKSICPDHLADKIQLLMAYVDAGDSLEVPDPYYGKAADFEMVLDLVEQGSRGLISHLIAQRASGRGAQK